MVRENMRSPRAELRINRLRKKLQGLVSGFDSRLATRRLPVVHGGLAQMAERSLRMRQARGSMPLSSTRAHAQRLLPGLVSSVGRAHDS